MGILYLKKIHQVIYHIMIRSEKMKVDEIQKMIDQTEYWDVDILDLKVSYFGDEVEIIIDNDENTCWKIVFVSCYKVSYETDANRRNINKVKEMKEPQLGYFGQDISVCESEEPNFYKITMDLSIMEMIVECKDILIDKISKGNLKLFWKE